jgi:hypothetical protein
MPRREAIPRGQAIVQAEREARDLHKRFHAAEIVVPSMVFVTA